MATRPIEKQIDVDAPRERVWSVLTGGSTYRQWTAVFAEGSYAETDWQEGGSVRFLGPDGPGCSVVSSPATHRSCSTSSTPASWAAARTTPRASMRACGRGRTRRTAWWRRTAGRT